MDIKDGKAYQTETSDGKFTFNRIKKPTVKGGVIYNIIETETTLFKGDYFLPMWDSTDHLQFACQKCKSAADVLRIKFDTKYAGPPDPKYVMLFYLGCPACGLSGVRKIYLDVNLAKWHNQVAFDGEKLYVYGNERKPVQVLDVEIKQPEKEK